MKSWFIHLHFDLFFKLVYYSFIFIILITKLFSTFRSSLMVCKSGRYHAINYLLFQKADFSWLLIKTSRPLLDRHLPLRLFFFFGWRGEGLNSFLTLTNYQSASSREKFLVTISFNTFDRKFQSNRKKGGKQEDSVKIPKCINGIKQYCSVNTSSLTSIFLL